MRAKTSLTLIVIPALLILVLGGCGGGGSSQPSGKNNGGTAKQQASSGAKTKPGATTAGAPGNATTNSMTSSGATEARAGTTMGQGSATAGGGNPQDVKVQVSGTKGINFNGTCSVGGKRSDVKGQVPKSFAYKVGDVQRLKCRIRKRSNGVDAIKVVVEGGGSSHVLQTASRWATLEFDYSKLGFASSTSSSVSGSASSSSQTQNSSSSSSSSTNSP